MNEFNLDKTEPTWIDAKNELPPVNTIVRVVLTNETESFDFVNVPIDEEAPFQHFLVKKWRYCTRNELNNLLSSANKMRREQLK